MIYLKKIIVPSTEMASSQGFLLDSDQIINFVLLSKAIP